MDFIIVIHSFLVGILLLSFEDSRIAPLRLKNWNPANRQSINSVTSPLGSFRNLIQFLSFLIPNRSSRYEDFRILAQVYWTPDEWAS